MNNQIKRYLSVLVAVLLLFSALPLGALAASGSTDITATVRHERTMTILPHPHGELLYVAPLGLYEGDEVSFTPVPDAGYALKSIVWYTTDAANATDITAAKKFTMPDADVTVKVEFAEIVAATVGGKVTEGGANVPDAAVKLYLGTVEIAATVTDKDGNYSFYNVEKGTYNIVVTKGDKVKTVLVTVDSTGSFSVDVALPVSAVSSKVEHKGNEVSGAKSDISKTVAGGLDKVAEKHKPEKDGDKVTIKLTVEPKADANTQEQQAIKREAGNGKKVEFLDLSLWKQVNDAAAQPIGDTNTQLLTIVIPFDFTGVDVSSVMILRHHKGETATLGDESNKNDDGEYVEIDEAAGTITLYAMKFSDYAIAYDTIVDEDECVRTETVKLTENGTYGLKLGGRDAGKFTFEKNGSGWNIHNGEKYLAMQDGKLALSDTAFAWTYKNGAFSASTKTTQKTGGHWFGFIYIPGSNRTVTTTYYLSTVTDGGKLSTNSVKAELYVEASGDHVWGAWTDCKDGENHKRVCKNCGETETEAHSYGESHKCVCGAVDPASASVKISVSVKEKTEKQYVGFWPFGYYKNVKTYTATIKTEATGTKVTKVQYQLNGGRWTTGTSISSDKPISSLKVKVTDSNGKVYDYTYGR